MINIHQNRLISPISTTRDHFHFRQIWDCFDTISLQFQVLVKKTNDWSGKIAHFLWYIKMDSTSFHQLFEPNKKRFIALPFICCRLPTNWHLSKKNHTPAPEKVFFLDLRPNKRHVGWKNNSKHFLFRCCYINLCPFARKSQLCTRIVGRKIVICGQTNKNEYSSASAKIALNRFSNLHVFFRVSNPKKVFSRGPVCHWCHYLILSSW